MEEEAAQPKIEQDKSGSEHNEGAAAEEQSKAGDKEDSEATLIDATQRQHIEIEEWPGKTDEKRYERISKWLAKAAQQKREKTNKRHNHGNGSHATSVWHGRYWRMPEAREPATPTPRAITRWNGGTGPFRERNRAQRGATLQGGTIRDTRSAPRRQQRQVSPRSRNYCQHNWRSERPDPRQDTIGWTRVNRNDMANMWRTLESTSQEKDGYRHRREPIRTYRGGPRSRTGRKEWQRNRTSHQTRDSRTTVGLMFIILKLASMAASATVHPNVTSGAEMVDFRRWPMQDSPQRQRHATRQKAWTNGLGRHEGATPIQKWRNEANGTEWRWPTARTSTNLRQEPIKGETKKMVDTQQWTGIGQRNTIHTDRITRVQRERPQGFRATRQDITRTTAPAEHSLEREVRRKVGRNKRKSAGEEPSTTVPLFEAVGDAVNAAVETIARCAAEAARWVWSKLLVGIIGLASIIGGAIAVKHGWKLWHASPNDKATQWQWETADKAGRSHGARAPPNTPMMRNRRCTNPECAGRNGRHPLSLASQVAIRMEQLNRICEETGGEVQPTSLHTAKEYKRWRKAIRKDVRGRIAIKRINERNKARPTNEDLTSVKHLTHTDHVRPQNLPIITTQSWK